MGIDQIQNIQKGKAALQVEYGEMEEREQAKLFKQTGRLGCFGNVRVNYEPYTVDALRDIVSDIRVTNFLEVKEDLEKEGVNLTYRDKLSEELGFMTDSLVQGAVQVHTRERRTQTLDLFHSGVAVTGICFPDQPTVQSLLPIIAMADLMARGKIQTAYFAIPVGAYAAAGLPRYMQYQKIVGLLQHLFAEKLGKQVFLIPDTQPEIQEGKYIAERMSAKTISDRLARKKYPFGNLFAAIETGGYGSDIALPALAEGKDVTIVCDYRQFESIHAGIKTVASVIPEQQVEAVVLTLVNPVHKKGQIREVSHDLGDIPQENITQLAETNALFYEAAVLLPEEKVRQFYHSFREGTIDMSELARQVQVAKEILFSHLRPVSSETIHHLEEVSVARLRPARDKLRGIQELRLKEALYAPK